MEFELDAPATAKRLGYKNQLTLLLYHHRELSLNIQEDDISNHSTNGLGYHHNTIHVGYILQNYTATYAFLISASVALLVIPNMV